MNDLIKAAKFTYYQNQIQKNSNNSASLWKCVNEICGKSGDHSDIDKIFKDNGELTTNEREIASEFNVYFSQIGKKLAKEIKHTGNHQRTWKTYLPNSLYLAETNEQEVRQIITKFKNRKAPGIDSITSEILKMLIDHIVKPLVYLINRCFETGEFPLAFKIAVIKPLFKSGSKKIVSNYRPISLISSLAKVIETVMKNRIAGYLEKYNVLSEKQYGFRADRSAQDAINHVCTRISQYVDEKQPTLCVFVDLAKAFDTVCHTQLLDILEGIGFRGIPYTIMKNYLLDRRHHVKINNSLSESANIEYGVPQGTVLGPVLFSIYLNDLFKLELNGEVVSFADDTAILFTDRDWNTLKRKAEKDLENLSKWFDSRLLTINFSKTHYIPFTSYSNNLPEFESLAIHRGNIEMEIHVADSIKYLGIY